MKKTIRHRAVDILNQIGQSNAFAGELLDTALEQHSLSGTADGRLLTHLVYGVLRMQGHLDWIISRLYRGNYLMMDESIKNVLRTGLYQIKFSNRLPAFAAVDEAVKIAKHISPAAGGLINAVLRSYLRNADNIFFPSAEEDTEEYIAAFHAHPLWLVKTWLNIFGREETLALCEINNELPPLTLRANTLKIPRAMLEKKLKTENIRCESTRFSPDGVNIFDPVQPIQKTSFFKEGLFRLQDEAAQLVSFLLNPSDGENILDVCAGSGGKTTHLAALMKNNGRIVAMDRNIEKITQLQKDALRMGVSIVETRQADLRHPLSREFIEKFDRVLIDAPCSGTGTLRRNPEIKWRLKSNNIKAQTKIQKTILQNASIAVKKGGCLVYCTCSILPAENEDIVGHFLADCTQFRVEKPLLTVFHDFLDSRGFLRTYPHRHTMDGFFGVILKRRI
jgi:16S rRNA (cytosine967-C5)-methyltransferase